MAELAVELIVITATTLRIGQELIRLTELLKLLGRLQRRQGCGVGMQILAAATECLTERFRISMTGDPKVRAALLQINARAQDLGAM